MIKNFVQEYSKNKTNPCQKEAYNQTTTYYRSFLDGISPCESVFEEFYKILRNARDCTDKMQKYVKRKY